MFLRLRVVSSVEEEAALANDANKLPETGNLSDLRKPQLELSPSDEADLFGLTPEEREKVRELKQLDFEVRAHEAQHLRAAGGIASGGVNLEYTQGPDGLYYAVAGDVGIQGSNSSDPAQQAAEAALFAQAANASGGGASVTRFGSGKKGII